MTYDPRLDPIFNDFDWDTSRRTRAPGQAPGRAGDYLKELGRILVIVVGLAAGLLVIGALACLILIAVAS